MNLGKLHIPESNLSLLIGLIKQSPRVLFTPKMLRIAALHPSSHGGHAEPRPLGNLRPGTPGGCLPLTACPRQASLGSSRPFTPTPGSDSSKASHITFLLRTFWRETEAGTHTP